MTNYVDYGNRIFLFKDAIANPQDIIDSALELAPNPAVRSRMSDLHEWHQASQFRGHKIDIEYLEGDSPDHAAADVLINDRVVNPIVDATRAVIAQYKAIHDIDDEANVVRRFEIRGYREGGGLGNHIDAGPNLDYRYSLVLYLNDSFTGGSVYFPEQNVLLEPEAGSIAIFPATFEHGVNTSEGGVKWHIPLFWDYNTGLVQH